jgi:hypothetical protein
MRKAISFGVILFCIILAAFSPMVVAQSSAAMGSISGLVTDSSGAAVPGAQVVVTNSSKGITRDMVTSSGGIFVAPALIPASGYEVKVTKQGFAPYTATTITVQVGETLDLHIQLKVGAVAEKVDVSAEAILLDDTKTEESSVINNAFINGMPINGRRLDQFVQDTPAVSKDADFGLISFRGMAGGNAFLIDGVDTTNQYYNENAGRTRINSQLSPEAVQEFQVLTSAYSAEFGMASGGTMNTVTKSGGNDYHGSAFEFFRNRTLDAIDRYATVNVNGVLMPYNPPEVRHQFGGTIGGKIIKDKLFFFFSEESQRRTTPMLDTLTGESNVNSSTQTWNGCVAPATAAQCTAINALLPHFYGLIPRTADQDLLFAKIDYRPNERNSISVSMNYLKWLSPDGIQTGLTSTTGSAVSTNGDDSVRDRIGRASWTYVPRNNIVNEFRFGWFKDRQADDFDPALQAGYAHGTLGLSVSGGPSLGAYNILPRILPSENRFNYIDNISWVKGRHSFKFGAEGSRTEDYSNSLTTRFGSYSWTSVPTFAEDYTNPAPGLGHWSTYSQAFGNPVVDTKVTEIGLYAQDTWKPFSKLTINYGVRYEYAILPQPSTSLTAYPQTGKIPTAGKNFGPRAGFAYAITPRNLLRAGFGIFYDRYESGLLSTLITNNGVYTQTVSIQGPSAVGAPVFPNTLANAALAPGSGNITFAAPNMKNPYSEQMDVALEHQFTKNTTMTVSYIRNRAKRLYTVRDINIGNLSSTVYNFTILNSNYASTGQVYSTPIYLTTNKIDKTFGHINQVENGGKQWYDAAVFQLNHRFGGGFSGNVSYTWSHEIDENQESGTNAIFFSSGPMGLYNGNYSYDKASGNLDQRQKFVSSFNWSPVLLKGDGFFAKYIANNWTWNGILTLASGRPSFESVGWSSTANLPQAFNSTLDGLGGDNRVPWLPNNPLMIDPITRFDTRISKVIPIREKMSLTLSFEAFNLTNTMSNTSVMSAGFTAANKGTTAAPNFVVAPCTNATATTCVPETPGVGTASAGFPDGTNARRAQVGIRFVF